VIRSARYQALFRRTASFPCGSTELLVPTGTSGSAPGRAEIERSGTRVLSQVAPSDRHLDRRSVASRGRHRFVSEARTGEGGLGVLETGAYCLTRAPSTGGVQA